MSIFKAKNYQDINNGRTTITTGGSFQNLDTSKDKDPTLEQIQNLNSNRFDDLLEYIVLPNTNTIEETTSPSPTPSITPTRTPTKTATPTVTPTATSTVTPTITTTTTPTVTPSISAVINPTFITSAYNSQTNARSSNGSSWSYGNFSSTNNWISLAYQNTGYCAIAYNSSDYNTSIDGINWINNTYNISHPNYLFNKIITGNNKYIVFANSSVGLYSTDLITWQSFILPNSNWSLAAYGNNTYVAAISGSSTIATSSDGITWTQRTLPYSREWSDIIYANNKFILIATNSDVVLYSADGITWNTSSLPQADLWRCLSYGNGIYVALVFQSSNMAYSTDGITWQQGVSLPYAWRDLAYGNNSFVAIGTGSVAMTSNNGITWTQRSINNNNWNSIVFNS